MVQLSGAKRALETSGKPSTSSPKSRPSRSASGTKSKSPAAAKACWRAREAPSSDRYRARSWTRPHASTSSSGASRDAKAKPDSEASLQSESNFSRHSMSLEEEDKAPKRDSFVGGNRDSSSMPSTPAVPARKGSLLTSSLPPGLQHNQGSAERLTLEERFNVMYESSSSIGESQTDNESASTVIPDTNQAQPFRAVRPSPRRGTALAGG